MTNGTLLDPLLLSNHIFDIRIGARLRGLEATVDGSLEWRQDTLLLHLQGTNSVLHLAPLERKVELQPGVRSALLPTRREQMAYQQLCKSATSPQRVRVIGPIVKTSADAPLILQVREFQIKR